MAAVMKMMTMTTAALLLFSLISTSNWFTGVSAFGPNSIGFNGLNKPIIAPFAPFHVPSTGRSYQSYALCQSLQSRQSQSKVSTSISLSLLSFSTSSSVSDTASRRPQKGSQLRQRNVNTGSPSRGLDFILHASSSDNDIHTEEQEERRGIRSRVRDKVKQLVSGKDLVTSMATTSVTKGGAPIANVLTDATKYAVENSGSLAKDAVELAKEEVLELRRLREAALDVLRRRAKLTGAADGGGATGVVTAAGTSRSDMSDSDRSEALAAISLAKSSVMDAFSAAESAMDAAERELQRTRKELEVARESAYLGLGMAEEALLSSVSSVSSVGVGSTAGVAGGASAASTMDVTSEAETSSTANITTIATPQKTDEVEQEIEQSPDTSLWNGIDLTTLRYQDIDYTLTEMAPPFIGEDECLVPGEPVVRVEKAPQNSRRIFAGIDIPVSVDEVWNLLTDYEHLQDVIPNLVVNEVLELFPGTNSRTTPDTPNAISITDATSAVDAARQCQTMANQMKGAILKQVGGAKVVGINFSARTTLEVREWPSGMPDFAHFEEEVYQGKSRSTRLNESKERELKRYVFPRPFALSSLPHKDISMQSVEEDDGEFRMYQGVWRMQPLPGCSPPGGSAMRLTYAVEVSPRPYLPVALVEGRIARDLCANLKAIRSCFTGN